MVYAYNFLEILLSKTSKNEKNENSENNQNLAKNKLSQRSIWISRIAFLFSISIVLLILVSVVFPALIASNNSTIQNLKDIGVDLFEVDPFQVGVLAVPLLVVNFFVFMGLLLYYKKKLPESFKKLIEFIFNFEISKKITIIAISIILVIYVGFSASELATEEEWEDYAGVKQRLDSWSPEQISSSFEPHVKYFLHWISMQLFGYSTVIPFLASISLLILVYFFTTDITHKRFAGVVAIVIDG